MLVENELDELSEKVEVILTEGLTKDLINWYSIIKGTNNFGEHRLQNWFIFQAIIKYFQASSKTAISAKFMAWKYKGLVDKSIKPPAASNNSLRPTLNF